MIRVLIKADSRYPIERKRIRENVISYFNKKNLKGNIELSIYIVGDRKMKALNKKYRKVESTTDVLAFNLTETKVNFPQSKSLYLGDIIISYPQARKQAALYNLLVDEEIDKLVIHGLNHLMGIHHS